MRRTTSARQTIRIATVAPSPSRAVGNGASGQESFGTGEAALFLCALARLAAAERFDIAAGHRERAFAGRELSLVRLLLVVLAGRERRCAIDRLDHGRICDMSWDASWDMAGRLSAAIGSARGRIIRHGGGLRCLGVKFGRVSRRGLGRGVCPGSARAGSLQHDFPRGCEPDRLAAHATHRPAFVAEGGRLDLVGARAMRADDQHARTGLRITASKAVATTLAAVR